MSELADIFAELLPAYVGDTSWQDSALCAQTDPEAFFPSKGETNKPAKDVCRKCEVRAECLEFALANDETWGIWGGTSDGDRRKLRRERKANATAAATENEEDVA